MSNASRPRPLERRILQMVADGVDEDEIARRFRRSPGMIGRVIALTRLPRFDSADRSAEVLRPLERRVLRWRDDGADYSEIGHRFGRSAGFVAQVEGLARYKLSRVYLRCSLNGESADLDRALHGRVDVAVVGVGAGLGAG